MCIIQVKVIPNSSKSVLDGWHGEALRVRLHATPEKGQANEELVSFLAEYFDVSKSRVRLISGRTSRIKRVEIEGKSLEEIRRMIPQGQ